MPRESKRAKIERAARVLAGLKEAYPDAATELVWRTPFELLVATILSAQATDVSVNEATPALFARYPDARTMAVATPEEIEPFIRRIGLFRSKAKNLAGMARQLVERHDGDVPEEYDAVLALAGVGRKTANVVTSNAFGRPAIAVDTHVGRLARRLDLSRETNPDRVERDLEGLFPPEEWVTLHHALILHGRRVCTARAPACDACVVAACCPSAGSRGVPPWSEGRSRKT